MAANPVNDIQQCIQKCQQTAQQPRTLASLQELQAPTMVMA